NRTSLGGYTTNLEAHKRQGAHWLWSTGASFESPGFELNDAGRLQSGDDIDLFQNLRYRTTKPGRIVRDYNYGIFTQQALNFGGVRKDTYFELDADTTWKNFWHSSLFAGYSIGGLSDDLTRGGPLMRTPPIWNVGATLNGNFASTRQWS